MAVSDASDASTVKLHLRLLNLDLELPSQADWKILGPEGGRADSDVLLRTDINGRFAVYLKQFASASPCSRFFDYIIEEEPYSLHSEAAIAAPGWHDRILKSAKGEVASSCLSFSGGIVLASFNDPYYEMKDSQRDELLILLAAVRRAVEARPPVSSATP